MRIFLSILITIAFLFTSFGRITFAQNITTGNAHSINSGQASAKSTVKTVINGSGDVLTEIEVKANEETKTLKATGPGEYEVEVNSSANKSTPTISPTPSKVSPKHLSKGFPVASIIERLVKNLLRSLQEFFIRP